MDDRVSIELVHCGDDALLEFLFRCDSHVAQDGAGKLGKEALDEIEPGAVLGHEGEFEAAGGLLAEPIPYAPKKSSAFSGCFDPVAPSP